jgi:hypothetical protein
MQRKTKDGSRPRREQRPARMSAIPLKADIHWRGLRVRFVPRTEIRLTTSRLILSLLVEERREDAAMVKEIRHHASKIGSQQQGSRQYLRDAKDG